MKVGQRVNTPHGAGVVECVEKYSRLGGAQRFGVRLEQSPFSYPVAYYWANEIAKHNGCLQEADQAKLNIPALRALVDRFDGCALECDGMTFVLSFLLHRLRIPYVMMGGVATCLSTNRIVSPHFWIALPDGFVLDLRLRLWLGQEAAVAHGIFQPSEYAMQYDGHECEQPLPAKYVLDILSDNLLSETLEVYGDDPSKAALFFTAPRAATASLL